MKALLTAAALGLALCSAGCDKEEEPAPAKEEGPPPISESEAKRAREACAAYQEQVCAAAEGDPSLEEDCELAGSRVEAVEMQLDALEKGGDAEQRAVVQASFRRVYKRCLEGVAKLERR